VQDKSQQGLQKIKRDKNKKCVLYLELFSAILQHVNLVIFLFFFPTGFSQNFSDLTISFRISLSISGKAD